MLNRHILRKISRWRVEKGKDKIQEGQCLNKGISGWEIGENKGEEVAGDLTSTKYSAKMSGERSILGHLSGSVG